MRPPVLLAIVPAVIAAGSEILGTQTSSTDAPSATVAAERLLGWYEWQGQWFSSECLSGSSFGVYSTFAGCQDGGKYATACKGNAMVYNNGGTADCDLDRCETASIFETQGGSASAAIRCYATAAFREEPRTFYRTTFDLSSTPASTTTASVGSPNGTSTHPYTIHRTTQPSILSTISTVAGQPTEKSAAATPTLGSQRGAAAWVGMMTIVMVLVGAIIVL